ncbi:hypothetical protein QVD17_17968 [Tagetes erecta]|uniref:Dof zinc finger protein n=1 Tax=Tagetes erecta TaxID=13708 RepID=A0AAD8KLT9_TARER|nr:hypothetical protein QVD17_17968 [Tagetes erecta]
MAGERMMNRQNIRQPQQRLRQTRVTPPNLPPPTCPRCASNRNKFCYYNNKVMSQQRYFCKNCRRFWTHVGRRVRTTPPTDDKPKQNPCMVEIGSSVCQNVASSSFSTQLASTPSSVPPPAENGNSQSSPLLSPPSPSSGSRLPNFAPLDRPKALPVGCDKPDQCHSQTQESIAN